MLVPTVGQMQEIDRRAIEVRRIPARTLMENAGQSVVRAIADRLPVGGVSAAVVCGSGNNGGDGCVVARLLHDLGARVTLFLAVARSRLSGDAGTQLEAAQHAGVPIHAFHTDEDLAAHVDEVTGADVIVDALLGTGMRGPVRGHARSVVLRMNEARGLRVAVDVPSGLSADHGEPLGCAFVPDVTVTFGYPKVGLVSSPGFARIGELVVADIGFPPGIAEEVGVALELLADDSVRAMVPRRSPVSHKGRFGHLLVVAGSPGKIGAAVLAAEAAVRSGAGLVTVAAPPAAHGALQSRVLEAMTEPIEDWASLDRARQAKDVVAFGPGVAETEPVGALLERLLAESTAPVVVDASGLNLLARRPGALDPQRRRCSLVLTPHPGEAARLTGQTVAEVQGDRIGWARQAAARFRAHVALKGARTVVAEPNGRCFISPTGNAGMATGGAGDVLLGVVGSLLCQRVPLPEALAAAVYSHGKAGDLAKSARGEMGLAARDLIDNLPVVFRGWGL